MSDADGKPIRFLSTIKGEKYCFFLGGGVVIKKPSLSLFNNRLKVIFEIDFIRFTIKAGVYAYVITIDTELRN